jgi:nucleoside-diphosphate-sugar epimerase
MASEYHEPLNLGTDRLISINGLVDLISKIAGKHLVRKHDLDKPQGVRGRNSDNTRIKKVLGWEPSISLETGLEVTYKWIEAELTKSGLIKPSIQVESIVLKAKASSALA